MRWQILPHSQHVVGDKDDQVRAEENRITEFIWVSEGDAQIISDGMTTDRFGHILDLD